jgi:hypothetical protein
MLGRRVRSLREPVYGIEDVPLVGGKNASPCEMYREPYFSECA